MAEITLQLTDFEDMKSALQMALVYFQAEDLKAAQLQLDRHRRPTPLTLELERVYARASAYLGDFLLAAHEAELEEEAAEFEQDVEGAEDGSEELTEASETLSDHPLGKFKKPVQKGRRLSAEEV